MWEVRSPLQAVNFQRADAIQSPVALSAGHFGGCFISGSSYCAVHAVSLLYYVDSSSEQSPCSSFPPTNHSHKESRCADVTEAWGIWRDFCTVANNFRWSGGHPCPSKSLSHFCNLSSSLPPCWLASLLSLHGLFPFLYFFFCPLWRNIKVLQIFLCRAIWLCLGPKLTPKLSSGPPFPYPQLCVYCLKGPT